MYRTFAGLTSRWLSSVGRTTIFAVEVVKSGRDVSVWPGLTAVQMRRIGVDSLPVAILIASFTGIVLAYQASYTLTGLVPMYFVGVLVGKSLMLELAPVLTGLALAGRVGANIAAELGTMRVTEQVDALETLAYDRNSFLVVPRVAAAAVMFPIVIAMAMVAGILAGWIASLVLLDISTPEFIKGLRQFYQFKDIWYGLAKSVSFGIMIALIGCWYGLNARGGAEGVGMGATNAVVTGASMILILDAVWAVTVL